MKRFATIPAVILLAACAPSVQTGTSSTGSSAGQTPVPMGNMPLKYAARPTVAAITAPDLMSRLYTFADDSMGGRAVGTEYNLKGAAYIAGELQKMGVQPAGVNGTYYQDVPIGSRNLDLASTITVDGREYRAGKDFLGGGAAGARTAEVVFMGQSLDTVNVAAPGTYAGKMLMFRGQAIQIATQEQASKLIASAGYKRYQAQLEGSAGNFAVLAVDSFTTNQVRNATQPTGMLVLGPNTSKTISLTVTPSVATALFGKPVADLQKGAVSKPLTANLRFTDTPGKYVGRNVVGMIRGSDPTLRGQFVAIGAHNDHDPLRPSGVDHDSLRAFLTVFAPGGAEGELVVPVAQRTAEGWARVNAMKDSARALHGGLRRDSIMNGADDDGSGSMALLEVAEAYAKASTKPKRSLLFVWYTGEERGMWGSGYFLDNPTVTRDSIISAINVDMVGRGAATDLPNAGPRYMQLLGSRRISKEYGDLVETVNNETGKGFDFDYQYDAPGHPQNFYCRSDHWSFARYDIPVVFFSTGGHRDYHQVTDEPQYINYPHYQKVTQFIYNVMNRVANLDHTLKVDKRANNPNQPCVQ